jgi:hypothetical protein
MQKEKQAALVMGAAGADGTVTSGESRESVTEVLDAVHRASFEVWWTRVHRHGMGSDSARASGRQDQHPKS